MMATDSPGGTGHRAFQRRTIWVLAQGILVFTGVFAASILVGNLLWLILGYDFALAFQWALLAYFAYRALRPKAPSVTGLGLDDKEE